MYGTKLVCNPLNILSFSSYAGWSTRCLTSKKANSDSTFPPLTHPCSSPHYSCFLPPTIVFQQGWAYAVTSHSHWLLLLCIDAAYAVLVEWDFWTTFCQWTVPMELGPLSPSLVAKYLSLWKCKRGRNTYYLFDPLLLFQVADPH